MSTLRAVVVDDDRLNREIVAKTLDSNGFDTFQAEDAIKGFREVENSTPQLGVIDVVLPGTLDGVGLCQMVRAAPDTKNSVIVMITASDRKKEAGRALNAGADVLIGKPFSPKQFWNQVEQILKSRGVQK